MNEKFRKNIDKKIIELEKVIKRLEEEVGISTSESLGVTKQNETRDLNNLESLHGDRFVRKSNFKARSIDYVPNNLKPLV